MSQNPPTRSFVGRALRFDYSVEGATLEEFTRNTYTRSWSGQITVHREHIEKVIRPGGRPKVIAMSWLGDLFFGRVPKNVQFEVFDRCLDVSLERFEKGLEPHRFMFLTKRPATMVQAFDKWRHYCPHLRGLGREEELVRESFWLGASASTPGEFLEASESLRDVAASRWMSLEPLLACMRPAFDRIMRRPADWIVAGAETGAGARPCREDWIRGVRDICYDAAIPFYLKQVNAKGSRLLDGREHNDAPFELGNKPPPKKAQPTTKEHKNG